MNKIAIVTGGASGIGLAISKTLLNNYYNVIVSYNISIDSANNL